MDLPLLGFDLGNITDSYYGQTEENMHRALKQAEGMAPCVLWIDEFEKMFSGASDGGVQSHEVTQRVNAIFLKWMEERTKQVFVVATSNDLSGIKAEYQRAGRWSGTFFFDLPSLNERIALLKMNLDSAKGGHQLDESQIKQIADATNAWASSDITALVERAIQISFQEWKEKHGDAWKEAAKGEEKPSVSCTHLEDAMEDIPAMVKLDHERLNRIRKSGAGMTPASEYDGDDEEVELLELDTRTGVEVLIDRLREKDDDGERDLFE